MTYDSWKARNPDDERLGPEPPPCEDRYPRDRLHLHPRYPSGRCVSCGAEAHQDCRWERIEKPAPTLADGLIRDSLKNKGVSAAVGREIAEARKFVLDKEASGFLADLALAKPKRNL